MISVVVPKYIVECDTSETPIAKSLLPLPIHGSWESIYGADISHNWVAILSSTGSSNGPGDHIGLYARKSLIKQAALDRIPSYYKDQLQENAELTDDELRSDLIEDVPPGIVEWMRHQNIEKLKQLERCHIADWSDLPFCGEKLIVAEKQRGLAIVNCPTNYQSRVVHLDQIGSANGVRIPFLTSRAILVMWNSWIALTRTLFSLRSRQNSFLPRGIRSQSFQHGALPSLNAR